MQPLFFREKPGSGSNVCRVFFFFFFVIIIIIIFILSWLQRDKEGSLLDFVFIFFYRAGWALLGRMSSLFSPGMHLFGHWVSFRFLVPLGFALPSMYHD